MADVDSSRRRPCRVIIISFDVDSGHWWRAMMGDVCLIKSDMKCIRRALIAPDWRLPLSWCQHWHDGQGEYIYINIYIILFVYVFIYILLIGLFSISARILEVVSNFDYHCQTYTVCIPESIQCGSTRDVKQYVCAFSIMRVNERDRRAEKRCHREVCRCFYYFRYIELLFVLCIIAHRHMFIIVVIITYWARQHRSPGRLVIKN